MPRLPFLTVDVFTDTRFGGNQLAIFPEADGLGDAQMQALAAEMNYSETTFVLPPADPANSARVRIFNRTAEMPFAGHPNVGTGYALALLGRAVGDVLRFEEQAGLVAVRLMRGADGRPLGAEIDAPQPLRVLGTVPAADIAGCIGLPPDAVLSDAHAPVRATVGVDFVLAEVAGAALADASPDLTAFRAVAARLPDGDRLSVLAYARDGDGERLRARMFAPLSGTWEDPATGSANATLAALLLSLDEPARAEAAFTVTQGVEMGRPSVLSVRARRAADGVRASVGGRCVPVLRGEAEL